jgi:hypothetical protein
VRSFGDPELEARMGRLLLAGQRGLVLLTAEDDRALAVAEALAERLRWPLHTWSVAAGIDGGGRERELGGLLARLAQSSEDELWLLFEPGRELRGSAQRRMLRELVRSLRGPALILVESEQDSVAKLPEFEIEQLATPDCESLREHVHHLASKFEADRPALAAMLLDASDRIAAAGLGLALQHFDRTLTAAILVDAPTPASITAALVQRRIAAACGPTLTRIEPASITELVGFERYLAWLRERALSFDPAARRVGSSPGAGVALVGVPGCGHRLAARVSASVLGLPLVRVDPLGLTGPAAVRSTLAALELAAPVVVWMDESDHQADLRDELARRLSERPLGVVVIATATGPEHLPSPWRTGHGLDELFFVELPDEERRAQLLGKLLARAPESGQVPAPLLELARSAVGRSGADLAQALTTARLRCFARGRPLDATEFEAALAEREPLATREPERIAALRTWAKSLARAVG